MKFIEDIGDKHKGEEIWVIGAGSSLDDYPIGFFKDKICIGMNYVFSVFLDVGDGIEKFEHHIFYSVHEHREPADWIAKHIPHFLENCFFLLPPKRRGRMVWWEDHNEDPYYMRWGLVGGGGVSASEQDFRTMVECIMRKEGRCSYVCNGTTLHWAIDAAVVLGAKKVYIVGGEAVGRNMEKHGSFYLPLYAGRKKAGKGHFRLGVKHLARAFKPYGIKIVYYYYGKGEVDPETVDHYH